MHLGETDGAHIQTGGDKGSPSAVSLTCVYPACPPERLYTYWTRSDLLTQWWPQEAEVDPRIGGSYHLAWPGMGWHLRGRYADVREGTVLAFTWKWDSEEMDRHERTVRVVFEPQGDGTRLTVTHGMYGDSPEEKETRAGHVAGWTHFLGRLQTLLAR